MCKKKKKKKKPKTVCPFKECCFQSLVDPPELADPLGLHTFECLSMTKLFNDFEEMELL